MERLAGKVAVVTGASKGMGRHFVAALVRAGMRVACLARPSDELDSLADAFGDAVLALPCDVSSSEAVNAAIARTAEHFGRIDIVVANAAIFHPFGFEEGSDEIIRSHIDINILGVAWLIRAAIPHLRETRGQIVAISSESVNMPFPMLALYELSIVQRSSRRTAQRRYSRHHFAFGVGEGWIGWLELVAGHDRGLLQKDR